MKLLPYKLKNRPTMFHRRKSKQRREWVLTAMEAKAWNDIQVFKMAAVFAFSRNAAKKFCKNTSFSKLFLFRWNIFAFFSWFFFILLARSANVSCQNYKSCLFFAFLTVTYISLFMYGRSRRYSGDGRVQHRKRLGKRELHPGRPEDESKFKMIVRPLGFTVMVWYDKWLLHLRT